MKRCYSVSEKGNLNPQVYIRRSDQPDLPEVLFPARSFTGTALPRISSLARPGCVGCVEGCHKQKRPRSSPPHTLHGRGWGANRAACRNKRVSSCTAFYPSLASCLLETFSDVSGQTPKIDMERAHFYAYDLRYADVGGATLTR
eukprot:2651373-Pleurochrysis_carterae.AAC.1